MTLRVSQVSIRASLRAFAFMFEFQYCSASLRLPLHPTEELNLLAHYEISTLPYVPWHRASCGANRIPAIYMSMS